MHAGGQQLGRQVVGPVVVGREHVRPARMCQPPEETLPHRDLDLL